MSDDIYDDDSVDVVQPNEVGPMARLLHAPSAMALAGPTHHQGADYGLPDTTVTIAGGESGTILSCIHGGRSYLSGETAVVPAVVASLWVRSGWARTYFGADAVDDADETVTEADSQPEVTSTKAPTKPPAKSPARSAAAGSGTRSPKQ